MKKVTVDLSTSGIERLQKAVREYKQWQKKKTDELTRRLAMLGATTASL